MIQNHVASIIELDMKVKYDQTSVFSYILRIKTYQILPTVKPNRFLIEYIYSFWSTLYIIFAI